MGVSVTVGGGFTIVAAVVVVAAVPVLEGSTNKGFSEAGAARVLFPVAVASVELPTTVEPGVGFGVGLGDEGEPSATACLGGPSSAWKSKWSWSSPVGSKFNAERFCCFFAGASGPPVRSGAMVSLGR